MSKLDELYERLGVRKGISAAGSTTMYGGSKLRSEVTEIMIEASTVMLDMDELNKAAGKMIGDYSFRERGFAKEAFGFWLKYGFEQLGFEKIYIYTDKKNTSNIGLNLKLGFKKVNIENKPNDHSQEFLKMEILKSDIRKINKALSID